MANIGVYIELKEGIFKKSNKDAIGLAHRSGHEVYGIIFSSNPGQYEAQLRGINKLIAVKSADGKYQPDPYAETIAKIIEKYDLQYFVGAYSTQGRELLPRVSAKIEGAGLINDCVKVDFENNTVIKPVYAGKLLAEYSIDSKYKIFSIRPNIFPPVDDNCDTKYPVENFDLIPADINTNIVQTIKCESQKIDLGEADVIVSGGRGMKSKENFAILTSLAKVFNAGVGASRAAVDSEFAGHDMQVGQTGKVVNPKLYIACGISGAIQHLVGMKTSKVIVAINKDSEAPIFKKADYGIVGDLFEIVPLLEKELKENL